LLIYKIKKVHEHAKVNLSHIWLRLCTFARFRGRTRKTAKKHDCTVWYSAWPITVFHLLLLHSLAAIIIPFHRQLIYTTWTSPLTLNLCPRNHDISSSDTHTPKIRQAQVSKSSRYKAFACYTVVYGGFFFRHLSVGHHCANYFYRVFSFRYLFISIILYLHDEVKSKSIVTVTMSFAIR